VGEEVASRGTFDLNIGPGQGVNVVTGPRLRVDDDLKGMGEKGFGGSPLSGHLLGAAGVFDRFFVVHELVEGKNGRVDRALELADAFAGRDGV
jgi:hypothetical protein